MLLRFHCLDYCFVFFSIIECFCGNFECFAAILSIFYVLLWVFFSILLCFSTLRVCFKMMCVACCSVSQYFFNPECFRLLLSVSLFLSILICFERYTFLKPYNGN